VTFRKTGLLCRNLMSSTSQEISRHLWNPRFIAVFTKVRHFSLFLAYIILLQVFKWSPSIRFSSGHLPSGFQVATFHQDIKRPPFIRYSSGHLPSGFKVSTFHQVLNWPPFIRFSSGHHPSGFQVVTFHQVLKWPHFIRFSSRHLPSGFQMVTFHQVSEWSSSIRFSRGHLSFGFQAKPVRIYLSSYACHRRRQSCTPLLGHHNN
jgi:hypothetical protein